MPRHLSQDHHPTGRYASMQGQTGVRRDTGKSGKQLELDALPSMDSHSYYDPPSPSSSSTSSIDSLPQPYNLRTNSGNKLIGTAQWMRRGKMWAWGPSYEDAKSAQLVRKRLRLCVEQLLPEASAEVGQPVPQNILDAEAKRRQKKRRRQEEKEFILPHLASPSPPLSTTKLAPLLALPQSYLDIVLSPSMRHSLADDGMETGLQRTAGELLDGEKGLMQALGRLREVLRLRARDVSNGHINGHANGDDPTPVPGTALIPPLPHVSETDNLWRVTQEHLQTQPQPKIEYTVTPPDAAIPTAPPNPVPIVTPIHRLFTSPTGITFNAIPHPNHPHYQYQPSHPAYPQHVKYNLDLPNQQRAVDDAIERISELLADCNEYKERLEETRARVADISRARKRVWSVVKERAGWELDRGET